MNTIRTPRQGRTQWSRRIARAVDDENWQLFRVSMKGESTTEKLRMLEKYFDEAHEAAQALPTRERQIQETEDVRIRVDNYIKALSRGGQLYPGESLETMLKCDWRPRIKRN